MTPSSTQKKEEDRSDSEYWRQCAYNCCTFKGWGIGLEKDYPFPVSAPNEIPAPIESPKEFSSGDFHLEDSSSMPMPNDAQKIVDKKYHGDVDLFTSEDAKQVKLNMNSLNAIKCK